MLLVPAGVPFCLPEPALMACFSPAPITRSRATFSQVQVRVCSGLTRALIVSQHSMWCRLSLALKHCFPAVFHLILNPVFHSSFLLCALFLPPTVFLLLPSPPPSLMQLCCIPHFECCSNMPRQCLSKGRPWRDRNTGDWRPCKHNTEHGHVIRWICI